MKRLIATSAILVSCHTWADAPVADRSASAERVEAAQIQTDMAWKQLATAKNETEQARQAVTEAEQVNQQAQQQAQDAARKLNEARERLAAAQAIQGQAEADLQKKSGVLDQLWGTKARPR
jgi:chromosome segregation ATPase